MTRVQGINPNNRKPILTARNTGYAAAGALLLTGVRAFSKQKTVLKTHKFVGYLAAGLTLLHIGLVEYYHHKFTKRQK